VLLEAFVYRHSPLTLKAKELVDSGIIGRLMLMEAYLYFPVTDPDNVRLHKSLKGGVTYDLGIYNFNVIRYIIGSEPVTLTAVAEIGMESGVDLSNAVIMEFKDGVKAFSHCSFNRPLNGEYKIIGELGTIEVPVMFNAKGDRKIIVKTDGRTEAVEVNCPDNYMLETEQFGRCITEGEQPLVSMEDSYFNALLTDEVLKQF
jgi:predicted dehydrogenase